MTVIDLGASPYDVIVDKDEPQVALDNAAAINRAIEEHPVDTRFVLPAGDIFVARDLGASGDHRFAAIRIAGDRHGLVLCGQGPGVTRLVLTGSQGGGLSQIIQVADGPTRITLCDFAIEHGQNVTNIDQTGLQNHQIELNAVKADVADVEIRDVHFGACVGDGIRLAGGEGATTSTLLRNTTIQHIVMRLGKHNEAQDGCRSGVSFQKGIQDLLLSDFYIEGPKNSCGRTGTPRNCGGRPAAPAPPAGRSWPDRREGAVGPARDRAGDRHRRPPRAGSDVEVGADDRAAAVGVQADQVGDLVDEQQASTAGVAGPGRPASGQRVGERAAIADLAHEATAVEPDV
ncbi:hypothetical protein H4W32_002225 [Actinophytocola algeriensis]|uniref:Parallel beta helix pectate lyase-like protein n=1 Tax=Actinophytocola algeriensis TaxID=1768010 RepID=A0A7W7VJ90_9PSEU|nr:hypothetical protein [Actinophytocola algeriensis]MBE1474183.1 hypothetical protein [Actinophytocola algeriensis]